METRELLDRTDLAELLTELAGQSSDRTRSRHQMGVLRS